MRQIQQRRHRGMISGVMRFLAVIVLLGGAGIGGYHYFVKKPWQIVEDGVKGRLEKLAQALGLATEQGVKIEDSSVILESKEIRELAVKERTVETVVTYKTKWLGSEKSITVKGIFEVKAGFDLGEFEGFELEGNRVVGEWPEPRLLSVTPLSQETLDSDQGIFNRLTDADRDHVGRLLMDKARVNAIEGDEKEGSLLDEVERVILERLEKGAGGELDFRGVFP